GFSKIIAISSEVNQAPHEDTVLNEMLTIVEEKDTYTKGHSKRVSLYARRLALAYESTYNVASLSVAACMHDIGKINVPITILQKPGRLTDEEFDIIKLHPMDSYTILKDKLGERIARAALQHHERLDGSGYPYGLTAEHISMDARIIAVADVFDAMTCKRTYNEPRNPIEVVAYLEEHLDQYDAAIIAVLRRKVEKGEMDDIVTAFTEA
ncbi:MAG: HD domain-containing protein, partial [Longicatena sp.]